MIEAMNETPGPWGVHPSQRSAFLANNDGIREALTALWESYCQAQMDLCGEQRAFHLPRLRKAAMMFMTAFPTQAGPAMKAAKDAWGDSFDGGDS